MNIILLVGKSTEKKKQWIEDNLYQSMTVSVDELIERYAKLSGESVEEYLDGCDMNVVHYEFVEHILSIAKCGMDVVVDADNLTRKDRNVILKSIPSLYHKTAYVFRGEDSLDKTYQSPTHVEFDEIHFVG